MIIRKPSRLITPMSPDLNQPSPVNEALVAGSFRKYPWKTPGPRIRISPSPASWISVPGRGLPTVPIRRCVSVLMHAGAEVSVRP